MTTSRKNRCVVCGKPVEADAYRIERGSLATGRWKRQDVWGLAHRGCFASAVESPDAVLDELRRTAREQKAGEAARRA